MSDDLTAVPNELPQHSAEETGSTTPEIVPVAAVRVAVLPNRQQRNASYTEVGSLPMEAGQVRIYANRYNGSLLVTMPDRTGFMIDTAVAGTQCYKYWLMTSGGHGQADPEPDSDERPPVQILGLDGFPI